VATYKIDNRPAHIDFEVQDIIGRTIQNAKNLLMLRMGEVPYDRYRGFDASLFDLPIIEMRAALLPELDRIMLWEPDVEIVDAECFLDENGEAIIEAVIQIDIDEE